MIRIIASFSVSRRHWWKVKTRFEAKIQRSRIADQVLLILTVWEDQIPGFPAQDGTSPAAGGGSNTSSTSLYNPALASLASRAAPNPHNLRTAQRNSPREGYVLSAGLATAASTSTGGEERQDAKRARYAHQRADLEVPESEKRGFELMADVRARQRGQRDAREKAERLRDAEERKATSVEGLVAEDKKKPITSLPVPARPGDGQQKGEEEEDKARKEGNPFWDRDTVIKREDDLTTHRKIDRHDRRQGSGKLAPRESFDSISSVTEDEVTADEDVDSESRSRSHSVSTAEDAGGSGMDWSAVAQDADAIELAARQRINVSSQHVQSQVQGQNATTLSQVSRLSASPPLAPMSSASEMIPDLVASGVRTSQYESSLVTPTKRRRSSLSITDDSETPNRDRLLHRIDGETMTSPSTPTTGAHMRASSLAMDAQDTVSSPTPAGIRSLTLGSSPAQATPSTMPTASNDLLSPLTQHLARQDRLIAASERSKEVLRARVKALEARVKELEGLLEQSRRREAR